LAFILNIETSSPVCSVCLSIDGEVVAEREDKSGTNHASLLAVFIRDLFAKNNLNIHQLDAVAVSSGPGSYTGLRIGVATAKGICFSLSKTLIAIDSLHALASGMIERNSVKGFLYCPTIDARRNEIYYSIVDGDSNVIVPSINIELSSVLPFSFLIDKQILIGGSGAVKCLQYWNSSLLTLGSVTNHSSRWMVPLSEKKFATNIFEDARDFEPSYIKPVFFNTQKKSS
jgi:tRNA threonylcarbamoyladenosine biosynthesis protein TsaB